MRTILMMLALTGASGVATAQSIAIRAKTADYAFDYRYPAPVARIAGLKRGLDAEAADIRARTAREAAADRREAKASDFPFRPHSYQKTWKMVTDTPRFLSLSSDSYAYTGGAHGQPASSALLWDKKAGRRLETKSVFASLSALQAAIRTDYCAKLKVEQRRRNQGTLSSMNACPSVKDLTLLLGSTQGRAFDRIGLIADPYVAGSYAEGAYEVTLPVTPALIAAVKPDYRGAFAVRQ